MKEVVLNIYGANISVYDDGSVWNHRGSTGKRRFGDTTANGYKAILVRDGNTERTVFVHRLVAKAFVQNPNNYPQVNHKDGNKQNNIPENLEWCTNEQNLYHRYHVLNNCNGKKVICVETNKEYPSCCNASRDTGISRANISSVCNKKRGTAGGYHWEFAR